MSANVHVYFMFLKNRIKTRLHINAFAIRLRSLRINGMMSGYDHPVLTGNSQYRVYPCQLFLIILLTSIRILLTVLTILIDHRSRIYPNHTQCSPFFFKCLSIITGRHLPTATHLTIIQYCLRITTIFVITQQRKPVYH